MLRAKKYITFKVSSAVFQTAQVSWRNVKI